MYTFVVLLYTGTSDPNGTVLHGDLILSGPGTWHEITSTDEKNVWLGMPYCYGSVKEVGDINHWNELKNGCTGR